jgi:hypothetical protein
MRSRIEDPSENERGELIVIPFVISIEGKEFCRNEG